MRGLRTDKAAQVIIAGPAFIQNLRRGHFELAVDAAPATRVNRWIENGLLDTLEREGVGCIGFSPLAQGMLTDRYLGGVPEDSRARAGSSLFPEWLTEENLDKIRALNAIATGRGQTLAQLAIAWTLRDPRMTSTVLGASSVAQLEANVAALGNTTFTEDELAQIDRYATESAINLWARSSAD
jgi:L-glyceraldehyde 3-phosphate reductase